MVISLFVPENSLSHFSYLKFFCFIVSLFGRLLSFDMTDHILGIFCCCSFLDTQTQTHKRDMQTQPPCLTHTHPPTLHPCLNQKKSAYFLFVRCSTFRRSFFPRLPGYFRFALTLPFSQGGCEYLKDD